MGGNKLKHQRSSSNWDHRRRRQSQQLLRHKGADRWRTYDGPRQLQRCKPRPAWPTVRLRSWPATSALGTAGGSTVWFSTFIVASRTITGATNDTPIQITTQAPHGLSTGQRVMIGGVGGNTIANDTWLITSAGPNTFTLNGSICSGGTYTSGGAIGDGGFTIPSNSATAGIWQRTDLSDVNAKWFGAKFDGTTDDTDAIRACIHAAKQGTNNAGRVIILPSGKARVTSKLTMVSFIGLTIRGQGKLATEIMYDGVSITIPLFEFDGCQDCGIENLRITTQPGTTLAEVFRIHQEVATTASLRQWIRKVQVHGNNRILNGIHIRVGAAGDVGNESHLFEDVQINDYTERAAIVTGFNAKLIRFVRCIFSASPSAGSNSYGIDTALVPGSGGSFSCIDCKFRRHVAADIRLGKPNDPSASTTASVSSPR